MALHLTLEGADSEADSYALIRGADVYVAPSALVELGLTAFAVDLRPLVSLAGAPGLAYVYDPASGTVRITCAAQCYATQTIGRARAPAPPARTDPGAFLNIDSAFTDIEDRGEIAAAFELGVFGRSGFGESTWTASVRDNLQAVRLETRWTMDDEPRRIRYRIGDSVARPGATADAYRFAGLQIARDFHLDPGFVTVPTPTLTGVATAPSVVDLYVDGALRLRDRVEAGPFTIVDPPVVNGLGQARVVVTDVLGRQQVISQNFYAGREMLRPGLSDFSVALGALRENFGYRSADYGRGAFSALYRRGLTAALTADVRADIAGGDGGVAVGGSWTPADVGQFDATVARSFGREGGGYARLGWSRAGAAHSMSVDLESAADGFRRVGSGWSSPRTRFAAAAGASSRRYGSVSVSATHADLRDAADLATVGIDYAPSLSTFGTIGFSLLYASSDKESVTATLSLVAALGETRSVSQAVTAENGHLSAQARAQQTPLPGGGAGWRLGARVGDNARYEAGASLHGRFGDLDVEANRALGQDGLRAQFAFSLVWIDGGLHAGRSVRESFAVVDVGVPNVHVLRQNRPVGVTGADGEIVVTDLLPYQVNRIGLEVDDLPLGAAPRRDAVDVTPGPRGGVMVRFPIETGAAGEVRVLDEDGAPLPPGTVLTAEGKRYPVGSDGRIYMSGVEDRKKLRRGGDHACAVLIDRGALAAGAAVVCRRSS